MKAANMISLINKVIMFAEDEAFTRRVLATTLARLGAEVIECTDGAHALSVLTQPRKIDIVLLDVLMPRMHGLHVLKEIRSGRTRQAFNTPVALLTATQEEHVVRYAAQLSCDGFIVKPVTQAGLVERLTAMLARRMNLPHVPSHYHAVDVGAPDAPPPRERQVSFEAPPPAITESSHAILTYTSVTIDDLRPGMVLAAPLFAKGAMLVPAETAVTQPLLELLRELDRVDSLGAIRVRPYGLDLADSALARSA